MSEQQLSRIRRYEEFHSWDEFHETLKTYQQSVKQLFKIYGSRTLKACPIEGANEECKYVYVKYGCKFGPNVHQSRGEGIRKTT